jgi:hypothetical protein
VLRVSPQLRPLLIITAVVTTGTATTAIIIRTTTTTIIIGTGEAVPGITAIGKAPARANEPEGLNLQLFLRHNRGNPRTGDGRSLQRQVIHVAWQAANR